MNTQTLHTELSNPVDARPTSRNVFVAEDDPELRKLIVQTLEASGFTVRAAADGRELLARLTAASRGEGELPDVIVMDVRMPRTSGLEVLRALRFAGWGQPVVLVTAFADDSLRERAIGLGASIVLDKPFDADDLVSMVDLLLLLAPDESAPVWHG